MDRPTGHVYDHSPNIVEFDVESAPGSMPIRGPPAPSTARWSHGGPGDHDDDRARTRRTRAHARSSTYRELLLNLTRRELRSRFRRSFLGWGWSFMQPLLMTAVYALVLGTFLKVDAGPRRPERHRHVRVLPARRRHPVEPVRRRPRCGDRFDRQRRRADHPGLVPTRAAADVGDPRPRLLDADRARRAGDRRSRSSSRSC